MVAESAANTADTAPTPVIGFSEIPVDAAAAAPEAAETPPLGSQSEKLPTSECTSAREPTEAIKAKPPQDVGYRPRFRHRRTSGEVHRCKKGERHDVKVSEWGKFGYAGSDVCSRPIDPYDSQTVPIPRARRSDITPEWFYEHVAAAKQPMIIEGAVNHWPAMERWSIDRLEERFGNCAFKVGSDKKGRKIRMKMKYFADYMRHQQDDNPIYLFETNVDGDAEMVRLTDDFEVPDFCPHDWFGLMNKDARPPHRWFCIGPRRSGTTVHTDPLGTAAWNAVTHGVKRWVLFEPGVPKRIVKGKDLIQKGEADEAIMYFDYILPRIKRAYPDVRVYEGLQNPGDVIFVPGDWWHGVLNTEDCVAVTQNYVGPDNFEVVWKRTRREREKVAYLWLRNMRKFAPELHAWAIDLNRQAGFQMRHERRPGEKLTDVGSNSSSSSSSSDSSSDQEFDVIVPKGLEAAVVVARAKRKRRRPGGWDDQPSEAAQEEAVKEEKRRCVASPMGTPPGEAGDAVCVRSE
mmetsp:Transcript_154314/g.287744  ORF Transcript_154314/g.287744 Transcript_154314/m.287744 type:complete len:517 (+) Transcript_154314:103-1653(+)